MPGGKKKKLENILLAKYKKSMLKLFEHGSHRNRCVSSRQKTIGLVVSEQDHFFCADFS